MFKIYHYIVLINYSYLSGKNVEWKHYQSQSIRITVNVIREAVSNFLLN